jgi:hypothetical protein
MKQLRGEIVLRFCGSAVMQLQSFSQIFADYFLAKPQSRRLFSCKDAKAQRIGFCYLPESNYCIGKSNAMRFPSAISIGALNKKIPAPSVVKLRAIQ